MSEHPGNDPDRLAWFRDQGIGLFVHWSVDAQLGSVISHTLVGSSADYADRYFEELPRTFNPSRFDPDEWVRLAAATGMGYIVFTTKHHNGFAMWDTDTTAYKVTNTPYGRDLVAELVAACRDHDMPVGFYFSPEDFHVLYEQGHDIARRVDHAQPTNNPELMEHNLAQIEELFTAYGDVATLFLDGEPDGLKERAWELQPEVVVTRGAMETPEQHQRDEPLDEAWEGNLTIGSQWAYKAGNERYKSGRDLIEYFIQTRAKGGNLLLNVGPRPDGTIPRTQEDRLRELGLWQFVNREAVRNVRPTARIRADDVWFTRSDRADPTTVYAFLLGETWIRSPEPRTISIPGVQPTAETRVDVLGQSGRVFEYQPDVHPATTWTATDDGIAVTATRAQRIYNADTYADATDEVKWQHPLVLALRNVSPPR